MIEVSELSKSYGPARALKGISFEVQRGDVLGFFDQVGAAWEERRQFLKFVAGIHV